MGCAPCTVGTYKGSLGGGACRPCPEGNLCTIAAQMPLPLGVSANAPHNLFAIAGDVDTTHFVTPGDVNVSIASQLPSTNMLHDAESDVSHWQNILAIVA